MLAPRPSEGFLLALRVPGDGCDICNTHNPTSTSTSMNECTPYPHPSIGASVVGQCLPFNAILLLYGNAWPARPAPDLLTVPEPVRREQLARNP